MSVGKEQKEQGSDLSMSSDNGTPVGAPQDTADVTTGPHRRPTTRSQSGVSTKRRRQERSASPGGRDSASEAGGRHRTHKHHKSLDGGILTATSSSGSTSTAVSSEHERSSVVSATSVDSESNDPSEYKTSQITFLDGSLTATATNRSDRPGPKSRANLPVPVPNLTKKSRGRRVPIKAAQDGQEAGPAAKDGRTYVCSVEGCGKCFHRGEHLKRHIRSIHTHEKPFKCTHGLCTKTFNRHDNLLQHLKVHKGREISPSPSDMEDNSNPPYRPDSDEEDSPSSSPPSSPRVIPPPPQARLIPKKIAKEIISRSRDTSPGPDSNRRQRSLSPPPPPTRSRPTVITAPTSFRTIYNAKSVAPPRYDPVAFGGSLAGPGGSANLAGSTTSIYASSTDRSRMAVSSLRTEVDREALPAAAQESPLRRLCELAVSSSPVRGV